MKMFKKIMAVALTAVMAVSMLTGCAVSDKFVENAVKTALTNMTQGASFSVSTKKEDKDEVKNVRKELNDWAKDNKTTAPTQDNLDEFNNTHSDEFAILVKYSTSTSEVQKSVDPAVKAALSVIPKDYKLKFNVSESFEAAKEDGKETKAKYAVVIVREAA